MTAWEVIEIMERRRTRMRGTRDVEISVLNRHCLFGKSAVREPDFSTLYHDWPLPLKSE
jgi:hypothetical protein